VTNPNFDLTGAGFNTPMGPLLANNIKPTIAPLGTFSGQEGTAISFPSNVSSQCPIDSYVWEFSNGTKSYGPNPQRAFDDNGVYDGQLTVTDVTGLSTTQSFTVDVSNVKPSVNAGPDTTADWGRAVPLNGQATDPGSNDQATLQYTWTFGDGSPSATGGPSVVHAYSMPGDYTATLKVCDKDGGCDIDRARDEARHDARLHGPAELGAVEDGDGDRHARGRVRSGRSRQEGHLPAGKPGRGRSDRLDGEGVREHQARPEARVVRAQRNVPGGRCQVQRVR
jgi:PKD domain-containing protein